MTSTDVKKKEKPKADESKKKEAGEETKKKDESSKKKDEGESKKKNKAVAHKYTHTRNENMYADYVCATCKVNRDFHAID